MNIRKYQVTDKNNLRKVCVDTAKGVFDDKSQSLLTLLYNDYYTERKQDNIFVLDDGEGHAVGYIICAEDFLRYRKTFDKEYLPKVKALSFSHYVMQKASYLIYRAFYRKYPAHLHIDILDGYTGGGNGSALMNNLLQHLRDKKIRGVMLCVGSANTRAVKFYRNNGFHKLLSFGGATFMAQSLISK